MKNCWAPSSRALSQLLNDTEAVEPGHLHVEKNEIRIVLADQVDGFETVLPLGHNIYILDVLEQKGEFVPRQLLIVHNYRGKRHPFAPC
jgi:hypothetical protein